MKLKAALTLAAKYTGEESHQVAILRDGKVRASTGTWGVELQCPEATVGLAVDAAGLLKMLRKAGKEPTIAVDKGRKLAITFGESVYHLQAIPEAKEPPLPTVPETGWAELTEDEINALAAISEAPDSDHVSGLRLHPHWAAVSDSRISAVAWVQGKVNAGVSVPRELFRGLSGPGRLVVAGSRAYVATEEQTRWTQVLNDQWPDGHLTAFVTSTRAEPGRRVVQLDAPAVAAMAQQALVATANRAHTFRFILDGAAARLEGGAGTAAYGARDFVGTVEIQPGEGPVPHQLVGVTPDLLVTVAKVVSKARGQEMASLSINGKSDPIAMWSGAPVVIEVFGMPAYLED